MLNRSINSLLPQCLAIVSLVLYRPWNRMVSVNGITGILATIFLVASITKEDRHLFNSSAFAPLKIFSGTGSLGLAQFLHSLQAGKVLTNHAVFALLFSGSGTKALRMFIASSGLEVRSINGLVLLVLAGELLALKLFIGGSSLSVGFTFSFHSSRSSRLVKKSNLGMSQNASSQSSLIIRCSAGI